MYIFKVNVAGEVRYSIKDGQYTGSALSDKEIAEINGHTIRSISDATTLCKAADTEKAAKLVISAFNGDAVMHTELLESLKALHEVLNSKVDIVEYYYPDRNSGRAIKTVNGKVVS